MNENKSESQSEKTQREDWLLARRTGIGGSDAAAVVGLSRFQSPLGLYRIKRGETPPDPDNPQTEWGRRLEPIVRAAYVEQTGREVTRPPMLRHPEHAFMLANLDGLVEGERIVEVKTARTSAGWGDTDSTLIPQAYLLQVQHYMSVAAVPLADVAVLIGGSDFRIYTIPADAELQTLLIDAEREFWRRVVEGDPPEPVTLEDMRARFGRSSSTGLIVADERLVAIVDRLHALALDISELEKAQDAARAEVMRALGERGDTLTDANGRVLATWKLARGRTSIDAEVLRQRYPVIAAEVTRQGEPSRRFLLKEKAE